MFGSPVRGGEKERRLSSAPCFSESTGIKAIEASTNRVSNCKGLGARETGVAGTVCRGSNTGGKGCACGYEVEEEVVEEAG